MYRDAADLSQPSPGTHPPCRSIGSIFDRNSSGQYFRPPNTFADWDPITPNMPGTTRPSSQELPEGIGTFHAASTTYASHSNTDFGQCPLPLVREFGYQNMNILPLSRPLGQVTNTEAGNPPLDLLEGMDRRQSIPETLYVDQPSPEPGMPSGVSLFHGMAAKWSGLSHTPVNLDRDDHRSSMILSGPLEHPSPSRLQTERTSRNREESPETWIVDVAPSVIYDTDGTTVSSPPLPPPLSWRRIPQRPYIPRTRDRSFLQLQGFAFSVNGIPGFNMQRARNQDFVGLDGRDDLVLENANGPVSCRLLFPGYPTNTQRSQIAVKNWKKKPTPIMRSKLAYEVAKRVNQYLNTLTRISMSPSEDPQWTVGQGCMKLEKMYLVNISWVSKGSLQPEIWVETDEEGRT